jgi:hypothetical protein
MATDPLDIFADLGDVHIFFADMQPQDGVVGIVIFASTVAYVVWLVKRKL